MKFVIKHEIKGRIRAHARQHRNDIASRPDAILSGTRI